jgi:hypothetical protein
MHLIRLQTLLFLSVIISHTSKAQLSIKNPQICHNQEKHLACINDGDFLLTFANGEFLELKTSDSMVKYSNLSRTITFLSKEFKPQVHFDTITISLLQNSILLKKGKELHEMDSLSKLKEVLHSFGVGNTSINGSINGLAFSVGDKIFKVEISTFYKRWAWDIRIEKEAKTVLLEYNGAKHSRLNRIYVRDENLRYGLVVSTSFRTLKKVESVESLYSDTVNMNDVTTRTNIIPQSQGFYFNYKKSGKLKSERQKRELKLCDCTIRF